jgi:hypothetical protein
MSDRLRIRFDRVVKVADEKSSHTEPQRHRGDRLPARIEDGIRRIANGYLADS